MNNLNETPQNGDPLERPRHPWLTMIWRALTRHPDSNLTKITYFLIATVLGSACLVTLCILGATTGKSSIGLLVLEMAGFSVVTIALSTMIPLTVLVYMDQLNSIPPPDDHPPSYQELNNLRGEGRLEEVYPKTETTLYRYPPPEYHTSLLYEQLPPTYQEALVLPTIQDIVTEDDVIKDDVTADDIMVPVDELLGIDLANEIDFRTSSSFIRLTQVSCRTEYRKNVVD